MPRSVLEAQAVAHAGVQVAVLAVEFVAGVDKDRVLVAAQRDGETRAHLDDETVHPEDVILSRNAWYLSRPTKRRAGSFSLCE